MPMIENIPIEMRSLILKNLGDWPSLYRATLASKDLMAAFQADKNGVLACFPPQASPGSVLHHYFQEHRYNNLQVFEIWVDALEDWKYYRDASLQYSDTTSRRNQLWKYLERTIMNRKGYLCSELEPTPFTYFHSARKASEIGTACINEVKSAIIAAIEPSLEKTMDYFGKLDALHLQHIQLWDRACNLPKWILSDATNGGSDRMMERRYSRVNYGPILDAIHLSRSGFIDAFKISGGYEDLPDEEVFKIMIQGFVKRETLKRRQCGLVKEEDETMAWETKLREEDRILTYREDEIFNMLEHHVQICGRRAGGALSHRHCNGSYLSFQPDEIVDDHSRIFKSYWAEELSVKDWERKLDEGFKKMDEKRFRLEREERTFKRRKERILEHLFDHVDSHA
ncbi:hypothetical protein EJ08DRAFT_698467 [Tothia fuscella]|uniref:Uncharacterized protein n=1 Tax=Tothia fuscella TaxID=1048955 RepID=A0A9P4NQA7_9PEZI|nr:hypothetical protein EJ08DRAFT_698467 [Tothia fuscella]